MRDRLKHRAHREATELKDINKEIDELTRDLEGHLRTGLVE